MCGYYGLLSLTNIKIEAISFKSSLSVSSLWNVTKHDRHQS